MQKISIGIDIGATKIKIGLVDALGKVIKSADLLTDLTKSPKQICDEITATAKSISKKSPSEPKSLGIGVAAQIDSSMGILISSPNLKWKNIPLADWFSCELALPTYVTNDVRAATWAEWKFGSGIGTNDLVCLFFGSGIGGGVISNGTLLQGSTFTAAELGHMIIDPKGPICGCGNRGCLEAFASGHGLTRRTNGALTAKEIATAYRENDPHSIQLIKEGNNALKVGLISIIHAFNPSKIIFGGGLYEGFPELFNSLPQHCLDNAFAASTKKLSFENAALKNDAGMIGAANFAFWQTHATL